jgi:hypothetical protein
MLNMVETASDLIFAEEEVIWQIWLQIVYLLKEEVIYGRYGLLRLGQGEALYGRNGLSFFLFAK